jgi:hypothetical protein
VRAVWAAAPPGAAVAFDGPRLTASQPRYVPAAGRAAFTGAYDTVVALTMRVGAPPSEPHSEMVRRIPRNPPESRWIGFQGLRAEKRQFAGKKWPATPNELLLAMQKVVGSSPISRFRDVPATAASQPFWSSPPSGQELAWAKINQMIAEQAPRIPFLWDKAALVQSKDVLGVASAYSAYITTHDLTFTSLKR